MGKGKYVDGMTSVDTRNGTVRCVTNGAAGTSFEGPLVASSSGS